jgi:hypothetical protein
MSLQWNKKKDEMRESNILFQDEDKASYVQSMLAPESHRVSRAAQP